MNRKKSATRRRQGPSQGPRGAFRSLALGSRQSGNPHFATPSTASPHRLAAKTTVLSRRTASALALLAFTSVLRADFVTGRVVDSNGVGVPGININAFRVSNGNEEKNIFNDGTDGAGNFTTTIPAGVYDLHFIPPQPPATTHVPLVVRNVVIAGTKNLGTLTLQAGWILSGHLQRQSGTPLNGVNVQLTDMITGFDVPQAQLKSDAFGNFSLASPRNAIRLRLIASTNVVPFVASKELLLTPSADTNLGNVTLADGFTVSGHVQRADTAGSVQGVNLDFFNATTGVKLFTPNDSSNTLGDFATIVPAGTYDIEFCAPFATHLVALSLNRTVSGALNLGNVALEPGFVMTGTIRNSSGVAQVNADVDVRLQGFGKLVTCGDNTNASGVYSVIVPAGVLKVIFHPANYNLGLGSKVVNPVAVSANLTLDAVLPNCASPVNYGVGLAGAGGIVPHLTTSGGVPAVDNPNFAFELQSGRGGANAFLTVGVAQAAIPVLGGTLLVSPSTSVRLATTLGGTPGVAGAGSRHFPIPVLASLVGVELFAQYFAQDPAAPQGWSFSEGVRFRVCR